MSPSQPVIEGAAKFLHLNHHLVSYLLRLRSHTLKGLRLTEAVLALMVLVAASTAEGSSKQARHFNESTPSQQGEGTAWNMLGSTGDAFISDVCVLLKILGGEPMCSAMPSRYGRGSGREEGGWWAQFPPSTAHEFLLSEQFISPSQDRHTGGVGGSRGLVAPPGWSMFDQTKLMLSLRVTSLAAAFLRRRSGILATGSSTLTGAAAGSLLAIDFDAVTLAFTKCAELSQKEGSSSSSSSQWLVNQSSIEHPSSSFALSVIDERSLQPAGQSIQDAVPALLYVVENLICVLHNLNAAASTQERACWTLDLDHCVRITERDFPSHSFVKQVGRWIRDQMNHENL